MSRPESSREEDLSTEQARPQASPRVPCPHGDRGRPQGDRSPPGSRAQAALRLSAGLDAVRDGDDPSVERAAVQSSHRPGRLTKRPEFLAVAKGRRFHTERVTVQGLRRSDPPAHEAGADLEPASVASGLRVGLTVTKRVGHATERNRIRRRLRAAISEAAGPFASAAIDVVLVGRRDALSAPFPQLVADLGRALPAMLRSKAAKDSNSSGSTPISRRR
jgi:ribonuclease P protein component